MADKDNVYCSPSDRLIYLSGEISEDTISKVNSTLLYLIQTDAEKENREKNYSREPIKLFIDSRGGLVSSMWSLISIMENSKTPIYTYCLGYAMSCAFLIFISGKKRFISNRACLMYHQIFCDTQGKYQDIKESVENIDRTQCLLEAFAMEKTKITKERLEEIKEKKINWYIYPDQAIELGCADIILNKEEL